MFRGIWIFVAVCLVALANPPSVAAQPHPHDRNGWTLGFNLGGGSAGVTIDDQSSDREGGTTGNLRVGYAVNPTTVLALESTVWLKEESGVTLTFGVTGPSVTFFPSAGFYLRGGAGLASVRVSQDGASASESGFGLLIAGGNEFRVARTFAIGPQVEYVWMNIEEGFSANYFSITGEFTWYWGSPRS